MEARGDVLSPSMLGPSSGSGEEETHDTRSPAAVEEEEESSPGFHRTRTENAATS